MSYQHMSQYAYGDSVICDFPALSQSSSEATLPPITTLPKLSIVNVMSVFT